MRRHSLLLLILCAILSGCAAREPLAPAALDATPVALSFSDQVAALPENSAQYFAESPFGPAAIEAGPLYLSGLGEECRPVSVTRGSLSHRFALCKEKHGTWRFIATVFESMPR